MFFSAGVYIELFATFKGILKTNITVCHRSVTAASNNASQHPAVWIVHPGNDAWPNLQITCNFQSGVLSICAGYLCHPKTSYVCSLLMRNALKVLFQMSHCGKITHSKRLECHTWHTGCYIRSGHLKNKKNLKRTSVYIKQRHSLSILLSIPPNDLNE